MPIVPNVWNVNICGVSALDMYTRPVWEMMRAMPIHVMKPLTTNTHAIAGDAPACTRNAPM